MTRGSVGGQAPCLDDPLFDHDSDPADSFRILPGLSGGARRMLRETERDARRVASPVPHIDGGADSPAGSASVPFDD
jgi:hypothetical protein